MYWRIKNPNKPPGSRRYMPGAEEKGHQKEWNWWEREERGRERGRRERWGERHGQRLQRKGSGRTSRKGGGLTLRPWCGQAGGLPSIPF